MVGFLELTPYLSKFGIALICGGIIGLEREGQDKPAGLRTCMLVTLAATMVMIFSQLLVSIGSTMDASRVPAYMLSGIGFLGAGIIMAKQNKVEGITTAAILLVLVPMGLLIGMGEYVLGSVVSIICFLVLKLKFFEIKCKWHKKKKKTMVVEIGGSSETKSKTKKAR